MRVWWLIEEFSCPSFEALNGTIMADDRHCSIIATLIQTCLCRARHSAVYAACRTMPNGSGTTHACRGAVGCRVADGSVSFGIVWSLRVPLGRQVVGRSGGSGFGCRPGMT
jgi:transposase